MKRLLFIFTLVLFVCCASVAQAKSSVVLSKADVQTMKEIFAAHKRGHYITARSLEKKLKNKTLRGYILADKYLSPKYKTTRAELQNWMKSYEALAIATDIYALAGQKKVRVARPKSIFGGKSKACSFVQREDAIDVLRRRTFDNFSRTQKRGANRLKKWILNALEKGEPDTAQKLVDSADAVRYFDQTDRDAARVALAFSYFLENNDALALKEAERAMKASAEEMPQASWIAGLSLWRMGKYKEAAEQFSFTATHAKSFPLLRGSSAFWAARSYLKTGQFEKVGDYLELASQQSRTFYGLLAARVLGEPMEHVWETPAKSQDDFSANFSHPALTRFYALKQVGKQEWARQELTKLYLESDAESRGILLMISAQNGFDKELISVAGVLDNADERFPAPDWKPRDGWKAGKALVFAFARQESCFNHRAQSSVGARGLMQIMPKTGRELARMLGYSWSLRKLNEPEYNLALGQNYLLQLMEQEHIGRNLMFVATAYNAGPGNLMKWQKRMDYQNDPLLYIESIPSKETRSFVERIMVNYWIYRSLMNQSLDSLDQVVNGTFPMYDK